MAGGYVVESYNGMLDFVLTSKSGGKLDIRLKSKDVRDEAGNRILYWFDFNNCMYDGEPVFDKPKKACHDREIILRRQVSPDTAIRFHVEWKPAKYEGE